MVLEMLQQDVDAIKAHLGEQLGGAPGGSSLSALQQQCADLAAALALVSERVEAREGAAAAEPGSNRAVVEDISLLVDAVQVGGWWWWLPWDGCGVLPGSGRHAQQTRAASFLVGCTLHTPSLHPLAHPHPRSCWSKRWRGWRPLAAPARPWLTCASRWPPPPLPPARRAARPRRWRGPSRASQPPSRRFRQRWRLPPPALRAHSSRLRAPPRLWHRWSSRCGLLDPPPLAAGRAERPCIKLTAC